MALLSLFFNDAAALQKDNAIPFDRAFTQFFFLIVETAIPFLERPPVERCVATNFSQRFSWHWLRKHSDLGRCYIGTVNTFFFPGSHFTASGLFGR